MKPFKRQPTKTLYKQTHINNITLHVEAKISPTSVEDFIVYPDNYTDIYDLLSEPNQQIISLILDELQNEALNQRW